MTAETSASLTCPHCGSPHLVEENAGRYLCLYCHALCQPGSNGSRPVSTGWLCPQCGTDNPEKAPNCRECGHQLTLNCLKCSASMAVWNTTCPHCGTDQAAYREQLAEQEQRRAEQQASPPRNYRPHRRSANSWRGFWRLAWMVGLLLWATKHIGATLAASADALAGQGTDLSGLALPTATLNSLASLAVGSCIVGTGALLLLSAALSALVGPRRHRH